MPWTDCSRESRMRETRLSGLKRGGASAPPTLQVIPLPASLQSGVASQLDDNALQSLSNCPRLARLSLVQSDGLTTIALSRLAKISTIQTLDLRGTAISDDGLAELHKLGHLESLGVSDTAVSQQAVRSIKDVIPGLSVRNRWPAL